MNNEDLNINNIFSEIIYIMEQNGAYKPPPPKAYEKMKKEIKLALSLYNPPPVGKYRSS